MSGQELVFVLLSIVTGGAALMTVTSRNLVHAALFLSATLAGIAGCFLVLAADFVAMVQLVVYVGAIAVLFLFGLMLTRAPIGREALDSKNRPLAIGVSAALFAVLATLVVQAFGDAHALVAADISVDAASTYDIGLALFADWVLPFELLSMLLLGALVGAILLSRREDQDDDRDEDDVFVVTPLELSDAPTAVAQLPVRKEILVGGHDHGRERCGRPDGFRDRGRVVNPLYPLVLSTFLFSVGCLRDHRAPQRRAGPDVGGADAQQRQHQPGRVPEPAVPR